MSPSSVSSASSLDSAAVNEKPALLSSVPSSKNEELPFCQTLQTVPITCGGMVYLCPVEEAFAKKVHERLEKMVVYVKNALICKKLLPAMIATAVKVVDALRKADLLSLLANQEASKESNEKTRMMKYAYDMVREFHFASFGLRQQSAYILQMIKWLALHTKSSHELIEQYAFWQRYAIIYQENSAIVDVAYCSNIFSVASFQDLSLSSVRTTSCALSLSSSSVPMLSAKSMASCDKMTFIWKNFEVQLLLNSIDSTNIQTKFLEQYNLAACVEFDELTTKDLQNMATIVAEALSNVFVSSMNSKYGKKNISDSMRNVYATDLSQELYNTFCLAAVGLLLQNKGIEQALAYLSDLTGLEKSSIEEFGKYLGYLVEIIEVKYT